MGQVVSSPFLTYLTAGLWLLSVVDESAATSCDQIDRASQSSVAWFAHARTCGFTHPRPCDGTSLSDELAVVRYSSFPGGVATLHDGCFDQRKSVPSTHMRCSTTASLRARAVLAHFTPRALATRRPGFQG